MFLFAGIVLLVPRTLPPQPNCALDGDFYDAVVEDLATCLNGCIAAADCGGFSFKNKSGTGERHFPD
jgi:hypothetical protein